MLLHVTASGNGYFENVWAWVADHDLDDDRNAQATEGLDGVPRNVLTQVSIYAARGVLIESSGKLCINSTNDGRGLTSTRTLLVLWNGVGTQHVLPVPAPGRIEYLSRPHADGDSVLSARTGRNTGVQTGSAIRRPYMERL
jgi:hypothetical protein